MCIHQKITQNIGQLCIHFAFYFTAMQSGDREGKLSHQHSNSGEEEMGRPQPSTSFTNTSPSVQRPRLEESPWISSRTRSQRRSLVELGDDATLDSPVKSTNFDASEMVDQAGIPQGMS